MILLDLTSKVKVFIWSLISGGRFSIILRISSGFAKEDPKEEDGYVIGYTHRGGGMNVVFRTGGFVER